MAADRREEILEAARATAQAHGYVGLSFRELGKAIGIKSASIHYHFPTKGDLGAALARRYTQMASADLAAILHEAPDPAGRLRRYVALFRKALEQDNRMCLCGLMAAEYDDLPDPVRAEVAAFAQVNVGWLAQVLRDAPPLADRTAGQWALALYAAIGGAQLAARGLGDIGLFDEIIASYRASGLIPG